MPGNFFDTNILLYSFSDNTAKADRVEALLDEGGTVSVQVLDEVANVGRRKMGLSWKEIRSFLSTVRSLVSVTPLSVEVHDSGIALAERYGLSVYDAMIAAAALDSRCDTLWSEDMHHGLVLEGRLKIVNPFRND